MDDNARRALFKAWFDGPPFRGDRKRFYEKTGLTKGRLSQILDPKQQFGERAARALAIRLHLPENMFTRVYQLQEDRDVVALAAGERNVPYGEDPIEPGMETTEETEVPQDDHQRRRLLTAFSKLLAADRARLLEQVEARAAEIEELEERLLRERPPAPRPKDVVSFEAGNRRQRSGAPTDREQFLPGDPVRRTDAAGDSR